MSREMTCDELIELHKRLLKRTPKTMTDEELQTLIKDMDDYQTGHVPAMLLMERATKGLKSQQARIEELEAHIRVLLDSNPNARLWPEWRSVLDVWRDEAKYILKIKGTNDEG